MRQRSIAACLLLAAVNLQTGQGEGDGAVRLSAAQGALQVRVATAAATATTATSGGKLSFLEGRHACRRPRACCYSCNKTRQH